MATDKFSSIAINFFSMISKSFIYLVESGGIEIGGFDPRVMVKCVTNFVSQ